jgi:hypothetical protein
VYFTNVDLLLGKALAVRRAERRNPSMPMPDMVRETKARHNTRVLIYT